MLCLQDNRGIYHAMVYPIHMIYVLVQKTWIIYSIEHDFIHGF
jgi:hypothetical protein